LPNDLRQMMGTGEPVYATRARIGYLGWSPGGDRLAPGPVGATNFRPRVETRQRATTWAPPRAPL